MLKWIPQVNTNHFQVDKLLKVSGINGMEWWNGLLEWNTGIDWDKVFALACNQKRYMDQIDRYYMINYASTTLGTAEIMLG